MSGSDKVADGAVQPGHGAIVHLLVVFGFAEGDVGRDSDISGVCLSQEGFSWKSAGEF